MPFTGAEGRGASRARAPPKIFHPCNIYIKLSVGEVFYSTKVSFFIVIKCNFLI